MALYKCIREIKPKVCVDFPSNAYEIKDCPSCTFKFDEKGNRSGECSMCGECCLKTNLLLPEFTAKVVNGPCPHLVKVEK